jgi:ribosomal RNA-processing protein 9
LWNLHRKKPVFTEGVAHGFHEVHSESEGIIRTPRFITALASLQYSDLFMSGMWNSFLPVNFMTSYFSFRFMGR